jgi:hypothetical protein
VSRAIEDLIASAVANADERYPNGAFDITFSDPRCAVCFFPRRMRSMSFARSYSETMPCTWSVDIEAVDTADGRQIVQAIHSASQMLMERKRPSPENLDQRVLAGRR